MKDREMLELAAKVQEIKGDFSDYHKAICYSKQGSLDMHIWRPLVDKSDAFCLAVKLNEFEPYKSNGGFRLSPGFNVQEQCNAIVRAAAEIGKSL